MKCIVVGGGVIGLACAYYLRRSGIEVTLIEKGTIGGGCSHANCGYICPSHALPHAGPGVIGKTLRAMFGKDSPLYIKPRFDPALWSWLVRFALRCSRTKMLDAARGIAALLNSSRALYDDLMKTAGDIAEWQTRGLLFVFRTPAEMEHYAATDHLLRDRFNLPARRYDGAQLTALEPALVTGLAGGWHYEGDAHLRPDRLLTWWRAEGERMGVALREGCPLTAVEWANRRVTGVVTPQGSIAADAVVVATGAWTPQLSRHLRCSVPIQPGKGYSITTARPAICPQIPMIFEEDRVAITPMRDAYRIGSTMEFAGYDESMNESRLEILRRAARRYLHEPEGQPIIERWWGWRPMVPDGLPIIGPVPRCENLFLATGHGMLGLSMAPATGKLITEMLTGATSHVDSSQYSASRF